MSSIRVYSGLHTKLVCHTHTPSPLQTPAGGYFDAAKGSDPALTQINIRLKEDYDGAEPAPSSIAAANLVRLASLLPGAGPEAGGCGLQGSQGRGCCL